MRKSLDVQGTGIWSSLQNLAGQELVDLTMAGDGRGLPGGAIDVDRVPATLAEKRAPVLLQMA